MPQADDDLRARMRKRFGDIDLTGPQLFLKAAGYELTDEWDWRKPGVTDLKQMTRDEFECLLFLNHEWDFGTLSPQ